jgi:hypothetical protein
MCCVVRYKGGKMKEGRVRREMWRVAEAPAAITERLKIKEIKG